MTRPLDDALELAALLRPAWADVSAGIPAWHLRNEGDDADDDAADDSTDDDDAADDADDDDDKADDDAADGKPADASLEEWKRQSRRWEREAKKERREREAVTAKLKEREDADKSEQEKAVDAAARQAREEALSESQKERRADKLEMAVTKIAAVHGVTIGTGDDAKTVKFTDPDDVQMWLEKQIDRGDVDADTIYKDGRVDEAALADELVRLAQSKPGWLAGTVKGNGKPAGDADAGKGAAPTGNSVEAEWNKIRRRQPASA